MGISPIRVSIPGCLGFPDFSIPGFPGMKKPPREWKP